MAFTLCKLCPLWPISGKDAEIDDGREEVGEWGEGGGGGSYSLMFLVVEGSMSYSRIFLTKKKHKNYVGGVGVYSYFLTYHAVQLKSHGN